MWIKWIDPKLTRLLIILILNSILKNYNLLILCLISVKFVNFDKNGQLL